MRRFDRVSSISRQMVARLSTLGIPEDRTSIFPNWVDTDRIRPGIRGRAFREEWGLGTDRKIVLYAGSMGKKQGLEMVLETAKALQNDELDIFFLLVGEGSAKEGLVQRAGELGLRNVIFKPPLPPEDFPALLTLADVHLVVQKGVAEAFMPSKLTGIRRGRDGRHHGGRGNRTGPAGEGPPGHCRSGSPRKPEVVPGGLADGTVEGQERCRDNRWLPRN